MGEMAKKRWGYGVSECLAEAFGIPFGLQGKPLTAVQLASLFLFYMIPKP
jgi:hypothetical protein